MEGPSASAKSRTAWSHPPQTVCLLVTGLGHPRKPFVVQLDDLLSTLRWPGGGALYCSVEQAEFIQKGTNKSPHSLLSLAAAAAAAAAAKSLQSCLTLCNPIDSSSQGSPIPGILQARTLEWVAISFSNAWKWKVKVKSLSRVQLCATPWTVAHQAPPSMGFSRQEYWQQIGIYRKLVICQSHMAESFIQPYH